MWVCEGMEREIERKIGKCMCVFEREGEGKQRVREREGCVCEREWISEIWPTHSSQFVGFEKNDTFKCHS